MTELTKAQFAEQFAKSVSERNSQGDRADHFCSFLRGYALTINDHTFEDAADFIDELFGELWAANEELAGYRVHDLEHEKAPDLSAMSKYEILALVRRSHVPNNGASI
jgi:hypothetical protein